MKIAVLGLEEFPLGKKPIIDQRLTNLEPLIKPSKTTYLSIDFLDAGSFKDADAIICEKGSKLDLVINDLEIVEGRLERLREGEDSNLLLRAKEILEKNNCLYGESFSDEERKNLLNSNLASLKPIYFADKSQGKSYPDIMFESYYAFGMICFITGAKDKELKAWPIKKAQAPMTRPGPYIRLSSRNLLRPRLSVMTMWLRPGA